jgi:hypothetical protein
MRPEEEKEVGVMVRAILSLCKQIRADARETNEVVKELKLWRKFVVWGFGIITVLITLLEFAKDILGWQTK